MHDWKTPTKWTSTVRFFELVANGAEQISRWPTSCSNLPSKYAEQSKGFRPQLFQSLLVGVFSIFRASLWSRCLFSAANPLFRTWRVHSPYPLSLHFAYLNPYFGACLFVTKLRQSRSHNQRSHDEGGNALSLALSVSGFLSPFPYQNRECRLPRKRYQEANHPNTRRTRKGKRLPVTIERLLASRRA